MMARRAAALLLLAANALAAAHLLFTAHTLGAGGDVVEAPESCAQPGHGAAGLAHGHDANVEERCAAAVLARTPGFAATAPMAIAAPIALFVAGALPEARPPLTPLSVAPKGSPPG